MVLVRFMCANLKFAFEYVTCEAPGRPAPPLSSWSGRPRRCFHGASGSGVAFIRPLSPAFAVIYMTPRNGRARSRACARVRAWARADARARTRAGAGARAGARGRARARARARGRAGARGRVRIAHKHFMHARSLTCTMGMLHSHGGMFCTNDSPHGYAHAVVV
jgi:hypothetical protein